MKNTKINVKIIDIERKFLEKIFNCKFEQLEKVFNLIRVLEEDFNYDLVKRLIDMVSERQGDFSLENGTNYYSMLINFVIGEFFYQYFVNNMRISDESEFFELLFKDLLDVPDYTYIDLEMPLGVEKYLSEFGITPREWKKFRLALDSFIKKKDTIN